MWWIILAVFLSIVALSVGTMAARAAGQHLLDHDNFHLSWGAMLKRIESVEDDIAHLREQRAVENSAPVSDSSKGVS